jgi:DNA topoisomerase-1
VFQYLDGQGRRRAVTSSDVNDYLREVTGQAFTAKDFRTWAGTVLAAWALRDLPAARTAAEAKKNVVRAVERVAGRLGNTVAICRKSYVHPVVFDAYLDGTLVDTLQQRLDHEVRAGEGHLQREEMAASPSSPAAHGERRRGRRRRPEPAASGGWPYRRRSTRACDDLLLAGGAHHDAAPLPVASPVVGT